MKNFFIFCCSTFLITPTLIGYALPTTINLGLTNFLDGGPLKPLPGWYLTEYLPYYHANKFLDAQGQLLEGVTSPHLNAIYSVTQMTYLSKKQFLKGNIGLTAVWPIALYSHVNKNLLHITDSGSGVSDLLMGIFLQWETIKHNDRPIFVNRLEFAASFPAGKYKVKKSINPGNNFFYLNPYWAATLFFTPQFAASWRLYYLWNGTNKKLHLQAGQAIHMNYDIEYNFYKKWWIGINGYFLQQLTNNKLFGASVPNSQERVIGIGPGALCFLPKKFILSANLYFETEVRNRPQGVNFVARMVKQF